MTVEQEAKTPAVVPPRKRSRSEALSAVRKIWPWIFFIVMVIIFTVLAKVMNGTNFLSLRAIDGILTYTTLILLVALGETLIIISAGIDLSVGYQVGLSAVIAAEVMKFMYGAGISPWLTLPLGMLAGTLICIIPGWLNGWLVARVKVPPFISTLGMGYAVYGVALLISGGYPVAKQPPYSGQFGNGYLINFWPRHGLAWFKLPEKAMPADMAVIIRLLPYVVLITILVAIFCWFLLAKTQYGQHLYAIGGNFQAAVRAGIPVNRSIMWVYTIGGLLAGVAGSLWAARFSSGAANAGETTQLTAIAAVVIGGASLFGGEGTIIGTVVGALIIATIQYGLVVLGLPPFWQWFVVGVVVIGAVIVDQFGRNMER